MTNMPPLAKVRDHHHRVAALIASGKRIAEVAELTGLSISRVSVLKTDPGFRALVEDYRGKVIDIEFDAFKQVTVTRATIEQLALEELRDRLEDDPKQFSNKELLELQGDTGDRLGRVKVLRSEKLNVNMDLADSLAEARRREMKLVKSNDPVD